MKKALTHLKTSDPILCSVISSVGRYSIEYRDPCFDTLVRSIIYQQVSGKAAATIYSRLAAAVDSTGMTPLALLRLRAARLRSLGISRQKQAYLKALAQHAHTGKVDFSALAGMPDDEVIATLTSIKGIGVWTAQMFLMFALRRPDVMPTGDLGIRNAMHRCYALPEPPKATEMLALSEKWRPWRSVACWYLWRSLDGPAAL